MSTGQMNADQTSARPPASPASRLRDLAALLSALGWLFVAWLTLDVLPGKLYRRLLTPPLEPTSRRESDAVLLHRVARAVGIGVRFVPWRAVCFHEGIATQRMLCARGIPADLHYGVARADSGALDSHVWVEACGRIVVGAATRERFTLLHTFRPRELNPDTNNRP